MRLIGYIRVSGEGQKSNLSLPVQADAIRKWCRDNGHALIRIEQDIESAASSESRVGLQSALGDIFSSQADGLVVYKYDRFCRSVLDSEHLKGRFKKERKSLFSVIDPVDWDTDNGEMLYQFMSVFAEYERKQIRKRCMAGYERKVMEGGYAAGHPPYGYDAVKGELIKNESELKTLRVIMELRAAGYLYKTISDYLNAQGSLTKRGLPWTQYSVRATISRRSTLRLNLPA